MAKATSDNPDPVDVHVGARIRAARKLKGLSQQALAESLGVTFQQVQKYERGANRISASMLTRAAKALGYGSNVQFFFDGIDEVGDGKVSSNLETTFFSTDVGAKLAENFLKLPRPQQTVLGNLAHDLRVASEMNA